MNKIVITILTILSAIGNLFAQVNFSNDDMKKPLGARAIGLGNAYTAAVDDATAAFWNPGALGMLRYSSITTTGYLGKNFSRLKETTEGSVDFFSDSDVESKFKFGFNEFSAAVPIPFDDFSSFYVVPSFSFHESANTSPFEESWTVDYSDGFSDAQDKFEFSQTGGRREFSLGLGFGLGDYVGLGLIYNRSMGELDYSVNQEFDIDGSVQASDQINQNFEYSGSSVTIGFKASTIEASDYSFGIYDDYGDGVDFGLTFTFPHQRKTSFTTNMGNSDITFTQEPTRISGGFAFRLSENLLALDASYVDYSKSYVTTTQSISSYNNLVISPNSDFFDNVTTFSIGIENQQMFRAGVMFRNYQYRTGSEDSQPWTTTLAGGFTAEFSEYVFWDVSAQAEFFTVDEMLSNSGGTIDYKGTSFNLFTSLRIVIPY